MNFRQGYWGLARPFTNLARSRITGRACKFQVAGFHCQLPTQWVWGRTQQFAFLTSFHVWPQTILWEPLGQEHGKQCHWESPCPISSIQDRLKAPIPCLRETKTPPRMSVTSRELMIWLPPWMSGVNFYCLLITVFSSSSFFNTVHPCTNFALFLISDQVK